MKFGQSSERLALQADLPRDNQEFSPTERFRQIARGEIAIGMSQETAA